jgi:Uma2 family endonuclease
MSEAARRLTYDWDDYRSWEDDQRWEIIGGQPYAMTPAPTSRHQQIVTELATQIVNVLKGKPCRAFVSPIDVKLSRDDLVQPDVIVVCDEGKILRTHIEGAPDMVVEVLSPSTALHDRVHKMSLFARFGVKEVWLVTPYPWLVEVFALEGGSYRLAGYHSRDDSVTSPTLPAITIDLTPVFDFPLEPGEEIEMVKEGHPPYDTSRRK